MSDLSDHTAIKLAAKRPGQATVEFALVLVVLLAMLYGMLEISRLLVMNSELQNAAREGAQYAALHPYASVTDIRAQIAPRLSVIKADSPDLLVGAIERPSLNGQCGDVNAFCPVQIAVTYTWRSLVNFVPDPATLTFKPLGPLELHATSAKLIEGR